MLDSYGIRPVRIIPPRPFVRNQTPVRTGVWVITHEATGQLMFNSNKNVSKTVDGLLSKLYGSKVYPLKSQIGWLQSLLANDPNLEILEIPLVKNAELIKFLNNSTPKYLNINLRGT